MVMWRGDRKGRRGSDVGVCYVNGIVSGREWSSVYSNGCVSVEAWWKGGKRGEAVPTYPECD